MALKKVYSDLSVDGTITGQLISIEGEYSLPATDGTSGQVLSTDGAGAISFVNISTLGLLSPADIINGTGLTWSQPSPGIVQGDVDLSPFSTTDLVEGTRLYFTNERVDDRVNALILAGTGLTKVYNDGANSLTLGVTLAPFTTTDLAEGTHLYFTNERVDDRVSSLVQNSATITWTYNDSLNTLTANAVASPVSIQQDGTLVASRDTIDFITGSNSTLTVLDDALNNKVTVQVDANVGAFDDLSDVTISSPTPGDIIAYVGPDFQNIPNPIVIQNGVGTGSSIRINNSNSATGGFSTVSGGYSNTASNYYSTVGGGSNNAASGTGSSIGGGIGNSAQATGSTVGGGNANVSSGANSVVTGGSTNTASGNYSTVSGGYINIASSNGAFIGGGLLNTASDTHSTVGGGCSNTASCYLSTVGGGGCNVAQAVYSTVSGGVGNTASGNISTVSGGNANTASGAYSTIGGGRINFSNGSYSTVGGGYCNSSNGSCSTVSGGYRNLACTTQSTVSGGYCNTASGSYSTVSGGRYNTASGCGSFIGAGGGHTASNNYSAVSGGYSNTASGQYSSVLGGCGNTVTHNYAGAVGCGITSVCDNTFHVNCLNLYSTPDTDSSGIANLVRATNGQVKVRYHGGLFAQTVDSATVSATVTETTIVGTGVGTLTVPANGFVIGDSFTATVGGVISSANNETVRIKVKSGSVVLADTTAITLPTLSSKNWKLSIDFTVRAIGGAGVAAIVSNGQFSFANASFDLLGFDLGGLENTNFDTTGSNTLDITVTWGSTNASNSIYSTMFILAKNY